MSNIDKISLLVCLLVGTVLSTTYYNNETEHFKSYVELSSVVSTDFECSLSSFGNILTIDRSSIFTDKQHDDIDKAHCLWETVLVGRIPQGHPGLNINFTLANIDGVGKILGSAGWTLAGIYNVAGKDYIMPFKGAMRLDTADVDVLSQTDAFFYVVVHEIGHILGVGSIWNYNNVYVHNSGQYTGQMGVESYKQLFNDSSTNCSRLYEHLQSI